MSTQLAPRAPAGALARFATWDRLTVRQRKRWWEILTSFELRNFYDVYDERQMPVLRVEEQGEGILPFLKRMILGPMRWFEAHILDAGTRDVLLRVRRPFRFFFHRLEVSDGDGNLLGVIERRWSWLRRIYKVYGPDGGERATLFGPILRPWTFEIQVGEATLGLLQKRWSGLAKELFTDADNFGLEMAAVPDADLRALLFSATVLVDVVHFERSKN
jgi:uncharacterized protein YxjI